MATKATSAGLKQVKVYDELKELEEQRAREALVLLQKKHNLIKMEGERERARTTQ